MAQTKYVCISENWIFALLCFKIYKKNLISTFYVAFLKSHELVKFRKKTSLWLHRAFHWCYILFRYVIKKFARYCSHEDGSTYFVNFYKITLKFAQSFLGAHLYIEETSSDRLRWIIDVYVMRILFAIYNDYIIFDLKAAT